MTAPAAPVRRPAPRHAAPVHGTQIMVVHIAGDAYAADVRGHEVRVDQPLDLGGTDTAPSPSELFVVSLASCVTFYGGRFLERHGLSRTGFGVRADYRMADGPPARIASINLRVIVPAGLPVGLVAPLRAVVTHCTVHNTLRDPPVVDIEIDGEPVLGPD
ncbi:MAG: OsmC family protein [Acidimicrobiales bacterium]